MRFRLTVFLIVANAVLFFFIWSLESGRTRARPTKSRSIAFTSLEISGRNIDKPRVIKFENNRWRIVSPIDWKANLFAVNRIKTQLEFIDRKTSFSKDEVLRLGHKLSEYGLDKPAYVLRLGDGDRFDTIKIGNNTSLGDRFYLLDERSGQIVVVDREFVEGLVQDMERLRDQSVFSMPRFEVSAFSARMPVSKSDAASKPDFRRVGLVKDAGGWKFETPIVAAADSSEVDAFLNYICQLVAVNFPSGGNEKTGFENSALPTTITLQGTNKREVLMLGAVSKDGKWVYARLGDNPTVFAVDADVLKRLDSMQTALRDKVILRSFPDKITGIDISDSGKSLKLRKLKSGIWDVVSTDSQGRVITYSADLSLVSRLLMTFSEVRAREFVNDAPGGNLSSYGINSGALTISLICENDKEQSIQIGSFYRRDGVNMRYACVKGTPAVFGISPDISNICYTDPLFYRSRLVCAVPENSRLVWLKIENLGTGKAEFFIDGKDKGISESISKMGTRKAAAASAIIKFAEYTVAGSYSSRSFGDAGVKTGERTEPWLYKMTAKFEGAESFERQWLFTKRIGASVQYCKTKDPQALFFPSQKIINAIFELTQEENQPASLEAPVPTPPTNSAM